MSVSRKSKAVSRRAAMFGLCAAAAPAPAAARAVFGAEEVGRLAEVTRATAPATRARLMAAAAEANAFEPGAALRLGFDALAGETRTLPPKAQSEKLVETLVESFKIRRGAPPRGLGWPEDALAPDYRHFDAPSRRTPFEVSHETLERAADWNAFAPKSELVIVGLRGCRIVAAAGGRVFAREATPDHMTPQCVLGVWNRRARSFAAFHGSTVPSAPLVLAQQRAKTAGRVANLLPTGLHRLKVGPFRPGSAHLQPGAFRQDRGAAVLRSDGRSQDDGAFTIAERWDLSGGRVGSGVHAGALDRAPFRGCGFASAGGACLPGGYSRRRLEAVGDWAAFRRAAGLRGAVSTGASRRSPDDGKVFSFMLLTGRDLRLAWAEPDAKPELSRLRVGSSGPAAARLQRALGARADGDFGPGTQVMLLRRQIARFGYADGVVTPKLARDIFGFTI